MIGRTQEKQLLLEALETPRAEFIAVYGRRRIGKTFLIKNVYDKHIAFEFTGTQHASLKNQLFKFSEKIKTHFKGAQAEPSPSTWYEAFQLLKNCLSSHTDRQQVVFFDELPWIATHKSGFLEELAYFWNDWAAYQPRLVLIVCGSAAAWMLQKVVGNKGGLHNRLTRRINLKPFTLAETHLFLKSAGVSWDHYQTLQFYMAVGGVPAYLQEARNGETVSQAIERLFFHPDGFLRSEFENLYAALFTSHQHHVAIIKALAGKWRGLSRQEIIAQSGLPDGGGMTQVLSELEAASFIMRFPLYKKRGNGFVYRLSDQYSLFYLRFVEGKPYQGPHGWLLQSNSNAYTIWCGYAFETICLQHAEAIKLALGISGIHTQISTFSHKGDTAGEGFQIDLLIDRADRAINLCEIKFYTHDIRITDAYSDDLRQRREKFRALTGTRKLLFNTLITTYPPSPAGSGQIDQVITMERLFAYNSFGAPV
ncbi:MAG: ATP-binding protein [Bacteroidia bacterium]|nr:ATP-binding protein [Bacteroidia bacterium]